MYHGQNHGSYLEPMMMHQDYSLDPKLNIRITQTAARSKSFWAYTAAQGQETTDLNIFETHVILEIEEDNDVDPQNDLLIFSTTSRLT